MSIKELIEQLQRQENQEREVYISYEGVFAGFKLVEGEAFSEPCLFLQEAI